MKATFASLLLAAGLAGTGLHAAPFSGPTGLTPTTFFRGGGDPPAPVPLKVTYDAKRDKYCVTRSTVFSGHHLAPTVCRTAAAWNASGLLQNRIP